MKQKNALQQILGGFWTPTSTENIGNFNYIKKEETHVDGPWTHETRVGKEPRMLPDIQEFIDLGNLPWHDRALEYCVEKFDFRKIMVVVDPEGEHGKNSFKRWLKYKEYSNDVPATIDTANKMMEFVYNNEELGCFTFNFPRAMKLDGHQGRQLAIAIEALKDGDVYDTRYGDRGSNPIPRPQILVLCNKFFQLDWLTTKRYIFLVLDDTRVPRITEKGYIEMNAAEYQQWLVQEEELENTPDQGQPDKPGSYQKAAKKNPENPKYPKPKKKKEEVTKKIQKSRS